MINEKGREFFHDPQNDPRRLMTHEQWDHPRPPGAPPFRELHYVREPEKKEPFMRPQTIWFICLTVALSCAVATGAYFAGQLLNSLSLVG